MSLFERDSEQKKKKANLISFIEKNEIKTLDELASSTGVTFQRIILETGMSQKELFEVLLGMQGISNVDPTSPEAALFVLGEATAS